MAMQHPTGGSAAGSLLEVNVPAAMGSQLGPEIVILLVQVHVDLCRWIRVRVRKGLKYSLLQHCRSCPLLILPPPHPPIYPIPPLPTFPLLLCQYCTYLPRMSLYMLERRYEAFHQRCAVAKCLTWLLHQHKGLVLCQRTTCIGLGHEKKIIPYQLNHGQANPKLPEAQRSSGTKMAIATSCGSRQSLLRGRRQLSPYPR